MKQQLNALRSITLDLRKFSKSTIQNLFWICFFLICFSGTAWSQDAEQTEETSSSPKLHVLSNEELLKQAEAVIQQASDNFLAESRGLARNDVVYQQARQAARSFRQPTSESASGNATSLEQKRFTLDQAKIQFEARQQHLALMEAEKKALDAHIAQIGATQSAANLLLKAFEDIEVFLWEIQLRVGDQTLRAGTIPASLDASKLASQRGVLQRQPDQLARQLDQAQQSLEITVQQIKDAQAAILEAQAHYTASEEVHNQELKRQNLEQDYSKQSSRRLLRQLTTSQEALIGLNGTYNLSHRRFDRLQSRVDDIQKELEGLKPPESQDNQEEAEPTEEQMQALVAYHEQRVAQLRKLKGVLTTLLNQEKNFQADEIVLREQLFGMQVLANFLENLVKEGTLQKTDLPEADLSQTLLTRMEATNKIRTETLSVVSRAKEQLASLDQQIENSQTARKDANDRLYQLQEAQKAAKQAQQWDAELKQLDASALIQRFNDSVMAVQKNASETENTQTTYEQLQAETQKAKDQLESLEDPLLRSSQQASAGEYETILKQLFGFAELEIPESLQPSPTPAAEASSEATDQEASSDPKKPTFDIRHYQNLLSTQIRNIEAHQTRQAALLDAMKKLEEKTGEYATVLKDASKLALQQYGIAIELRKRLGQQQLQSNEIPDGITEALQRERILQFEKQSVEFSNQQTHLKQQIEFLSQPDKTLQERQQRLNQILDSIGKRLDIRQDQQDLAKTLAAGRDAMSEIEVKTLKQDALRLMESETSWQESLLGFVPSDHAESLVDLMQAYYQEWIELGANQENLESQTEKMERLIQLLGEEKTAVSELRPFLQQQVAQLTAAYEEEEVRVQVRLMPHKAEDLLTHFETKTGRRLSAPPPLPEENKNDAIVEHAKQLFDQYLQIAAARQWIQLFDQRLSAESLGVETGEYQEELGELNIKTAAVERRLQLLKGHSREELRQLATEDAPETELEELRYLQGEIGVLRTERNQALRQEVLWVLGQIGFIVVAAVLLIILVNLSIGQLTKRAQDRNANAHTLFVLSFFNAFLKLVIWITAIIFMFSALGFQVGAILAGLGIGGLAIAMAARETLANILGGIMIFLERPFAIGDVIFVRDRPAKVAGMTWRTTRFILPAGYSFCVPNSQLTESTIFNFSHTPDPEDSIHIYLSAKYDPEVVLPLLFKAINDCPDTLEEGVGGRLDGALMMGSMTVADYFIWWRIKDYQKRLGTRGKIWYAVWKNLNEAGIEMEVRPFPAELKPSEGPPALPEEALEGSNS